MAPFTVSIIHHSTPVSRGCVLSPFKFNSSASAQTHVHVDHVKLVHYCIGRSTLYLEGMSILSIENSSGSMDSSGQKQMTSNWRTSVFTKTYTLHTL